MKKHTPSAPVIPENTEPVKRDFPTSMLQAPGSDIGTVHSADQPPESEYGPSEWRNLEDGFLYRHCVCPHPAGKTHKGLIPRIEKEGDNGEKELIHSGLFWEGTEEEWFARFRKQ